MARARFDDDDRDDPRPPARKKSNTTFIVGFVVGAVLFLMLVCGGVLIVIGRWAMPGGPVVQNGAAVADRQAVVVAEERAAVAPKADTRPVMSRKDFEAAVQGKTKEQIIAAIGGPDETREKIEEGRVLTPDGRAFERWVYKGRVLNEATGKPYAAVSVRIGADGTGDLIEYP